MPNTRQVRSLWPDDLMDGFDASQPTVPQTITLTDSPLPGERPSLHPWTGGDGTGDVTFTDPGTASDQTIVSRWVYPNDGTLHCGGTQTVTTTNYFTDVNFELIGDAFRQVGVSAREAADALGQLADAKLDFKIQRLTQEEIDLREANEQAWVDDCRQQTVAIHEQERERQEQARLRHLEEIRARRLEAEKEERIAANERRIAAEARGWDLLKDVVGEEEYEKFKEVGHLDVQSPSDGKLIYRVRQGRRIALVRNGVESTKESLCIHPNQMFVQGDKVAAQVMWCMMNEKKLMEVANVHRCAA